MGFRKLQFHHCVSDTAEPFVRHVMQSSDLQSRVLPVCCHENGPLAVDLLEPCVVAAALVIGVDAVQFDGELPPRRMDVGHLPVAHHHVAGQVV